jgi:hypothetical protein
MNLLNERENKAAYKKSGSSSLAFSPESSVRNNFDLAGLLACFTVIAFPFAQWHLITAFIKLTATGIAPDFTGFPFNR